MKIAVIIPCFNEEKTVSKVVGDFQKYLPDASIYVCDNASTDNTSQEAKDAGAHVIQQPLKGKGHAVRRLFSEVEADVYILVDGDATYDAGRSPEMVEMLVKQHLDMVVGKRVETDLENYRKGHRLGNILFSKTIGTLFGNRINDLLSGYRVLSRRYVKSFPIRSDGFQLETEMTVHALELGMPVGEIETDYYSRPSGSFSKLSTYSDGWRILRMIGRLLLDLKPAYTLGFLASTCMLLSFILALPLIVHWWNTGLVPRLPTAVLSCGLALFSGILGSSGLILDGVSRSRRETKQLAYMMIK